jgi:4-hydroxybenzoate polyprenyltransferase
MNFGGKLFRFFIYSNFFIASCAILMVYQTCHLVLHRPPDLYFVFFVFFASLCSYSFHWHLTPDMDSNSSRLHWLRHHRVVHTVLFFIGLAGVSATGIYLLKYWPWLLLSAFITFLYSAPKIPHPWFRALRKVAVGKTIFLAFVWMHVTTLLPLVVSDEPWRTDFTLFACSRFFLIYAICILFDYRDREYDISVGIRSLITLMSERTVVVLFLLSLLLFAISTIAMLNYGYSWPAVAVLLIPGLLTGALYRRAIKDRSDILYYFILDGLMALSSLLMVLLGI